MDLPECAICFKAIKVGQRIIGFGVGKVVESREPHSGILLDYEDDIGDKCANVCSRKCLMKAVKRHL